MENHPLYSRLIHHQILVGMSAAPLHQLYSASIGITGALKQYY